MDRVNIKLIINDLINAIEKIKLIGNEKKTKRILDYSNLKNSYYFKIYKSKFNSLLNLIDSKIKLSNSKDMLNLLKLRDRLSKYFEENDLDAIKDELLNSDLLLLVKEDYSFLDEIHKTLNKIKIPSEIRNEIIQDFKEISKCYNVGAYRSVIILCARILELVLHRKYYEATGVDLLEKSPGIGLGNLIAKLREKDIKLDPAISQQIHLINQIRIFSVHKKKYLFIPTKQQVQAILLYTIDLLNKLFNS